MSQLGRPAAFSPISPPPAVTKGPGVISTYRSWSETKKPKISG